MHSTENHHMFSESKNQNFTRINKSSLITGTFLNWQFVMTFNQFTYTISGVCTSRIILMKFLIYTMMSLWQMRVCFYFLD